MNSDGLSNKKFSLLVKELPHLHFWNGEFSHGGFDRWMLRELYEFLVSSQLAVPGKKFLETGAGLSTLLFLCLDPSEVRTVCLEQPIFFERLNNTAKELSILLEPLSLYEGRSELWLPNIVVDREPFSDFSLIDGGHGWPTVFVDFFYIAYATKQFGYVAIDDTQLYSVQKLVEFLGEQPGWKVVKDLGKLLVFQKLFSDRFLPDFGGQPYIKARSSL